MESRKVEVYFNSRQRNFSVRCDGKVFMRTDFLILSDAEFVVSKAGRDRVVRTGRKNIHAVVRGKLFVEDSRKVKGLEVNYNPFKHAHFMTRKGRIDRAAKVCFSIRDGKPVLFAK